MNVTKTTLVFVTVIVLFSIFFANVALQLDIGINSGVSPKFTVDNKNFASQMNMSNSTSHLMWFLQISDLHLSIFNNPNRINEFKDFSCNTVNIIKPPVVLASGDLTDAKHKDNMGSAQYKEEWILYNDVLNKCNIRHKTTWLDIRGNHDNFNVPGWSSSLNYFRNYSVQGKIHPRSYMHIISHGHEKYAFIGLDACLEPGPRRPFNFIGILSNNEMEQVRRFLEVAEKENVNHIVWFGHYPSSCIISFKDDSVRNLIGNVKESRAYLCGHLHQIGGLVKEMYTLQRQGYLELELGDWKDNRIFRLVAIDHGLFSFIDVQHGDWPIALITNPKHALYIMPGRESLKTIRESTYIRLLAFSASPIESVHIKIDAGEWKLCELIDGPLYGSRWNPFDYESGLHTIYAKVYDVNGRVKIVEQPFSIDGTRMSFKILAKIALMTNAVKIFQSMFGTMIVMCVLPMIVVRFVHHRVLVGKCTFSKRRIYFPYIWLRRLWVLSTVDRLFYPIVLYEVYLVFGPWSIGEVIEGHMGAIFSWGIILDGLYLPGSFTYAYGFIQMFICQFPLSLILAKCADERFLLHWCDTNPQRSLFWAVLHQLPFILIISIQMVLAYFFWLAYGTLAFFLGPLRTWSIALNIYLWYKAITLPPECTREIAIVWTPHNQRVRKNSSQELPLSKR